MTDEELRLFLHGVLEEAYPGLPLYYRPPGNLILQRPCIVYEPKQYQPSYASNTVYVFGVGYQVTILSSIPGYEDSRNLLINQTAGVTVRDHRTFTEDDIVNDVFEVSVKSITL